MAKTGRGGPRRGAAAWGIVVAVAVLAAGGLGAAQAAAQARAPAPAPDCEPVRQKTATLQRGVTTNLNQLRAELARLELIGGADQVRLRRQIRKDAEGVLRDLQGYLAQLRTPANRTCAPDRQALEREIAHRTQSVEQIRAALARF